MVNKIIEGITHAPKKVELTEKRVVSLTLPWKGRVSNDYRRNIQHTVLQTYPKINIRVTFTSRNAFPVAVKDVLPTAMKSLVVYHFTCHCGCTYVGRTTQQLGERIKQHIPNKILVNNPKLTIEKSDSAITQHLKTHPACISPNLVRKFKILAQARNSWHLEIMEAAFITALTPQLCQQKDLGKYLRLSKC